MIGTINAPTPRTDSRPDADVLLAESNHRISNNLALIAGIVRMSANDAARRDRVLDSEQLQRALIEVATRIETVGMLHRLLSDVPRFSAVSLGAYVEEICNGLITAFGSNDRVDLSGVDTVSCVVPAEHALPVALIVHELVTNAIKYAHPAGVPGRIVVSCFREKEGTLHLAVADDGVGLPEDLDPKRHGDRGFKVVRALAAQLGAALSFESSELGLCCRLRIPVGTA